MRNRRILIIGSLLVIYGFLLLLGEIFNFDMGKLCFPSLLILFGLFLLFRPKLFAPESKFILRLFGGLRREGEWQVEDREIMMFVGDIYLDFSQAIFPSRETSLRIYAFVGDIDLITPAGVGVSLTSTAFLSSAKLWGKKQDVFLSTLEESSLNYEGAENKIRLDIICFVADINLKHPEEITNG